MLLKVDFENLVDEVMLEQLIKVTILLHHHYNKAVQSGTRQDSIFTSDQVKKQSAQVNKLVVDSLILGDKQAKKQIVKVLE